jgi:HEAT repeat protein
MVNWTLYLESLCNTYSQWWKFGILKDVVEPKSVESEPSTLPFEFGLMVETVEPYIPKGNTDKQEFERSSVLEGLQKYAPKHVLLVGRPGSGKSTALVRLLVATAQQALQNPHSQIPVLVELRTYNIYYKTSVLDLVQASLRRRKLRLNIETLEDLLAEGRLLLLMDGINELPDDEARKTIKEFRLDYSDVPMVFATRHLSGAGNLEIETKLEMQSLAKVEVKKFVRKCMPGGSEQTLQQLRQGLRELGQTPFVMWMLYVIFEKTGTVPSGAGSAFREFTKLYERRSKDNAPVSDESRRWWSRLLEHLGLEMMQAEKSTHLRLTISKREAEDILTKVLDREQFDKPRDRALRWLEDLLKHHLIQVASSDQIEFCHQLIQEYYAAECLLKLLTSPPRRTSPPAPLLQGEGSKIVPPFPGREAGLGGLGLSDDELKRDYLNYLKWTEPLALVLELVEDEAQAVRVVQLALEVDLQLGARLAGAVKPEWHEQTVGLVAGLEVSQLIKIELLKLTKSKKAIPDLVKALNDEKPVRWRAADALPNIGSDAAIPEIVNALKHEDFYVRWKAAEALGNIGSDAAIPELVNALKDEHYYVPRSAVEALGKIGSEAAIGELVKALKHKDSYVCWRAAEALGNIGSEAAIGELINALYDPDVDSTAADALAKIGSEAAIAELVKALNHERCIVSSSATEALGKHGSEAAIAELVKALNHQIYFIRGSAADALGKNDSEAAIAGLLNALNHEDSGVRQRAAQALGNIGSETVIAGLVNTLNDEDSDVRGKAAEALGKIGSEAVISKLVEALNDEDSKVRWSAAEALGKIDSDTAIGELVNALYHKYSEVRLWAARALGKIGSEAAIGELVNALNDEDYYVRLSVAEYLGNIGSDAAIDVLINALNYEDSSSGAKVIRIRVSAANALGKIGSDAGIPELVNALSRGYSIVRWKAVEALGNIGSDAAIGELVKALNHEDYKVRLRAADALGKNGSDAGIPELVKTLNHEEYAVRGEAIEALGNSGSEAAIGELVKALNHETYYVRRSVAEVLGKIASPELLPDLSERLKTDGETNLLNAIAAIQERCKFYNYTLTQPSSAPV